MAKPIKFSHHALASMRKRGTTEAEVNETITEASWLPAKAGRFECAKNFPYNNFWNRKFYKTKQVVPVFRQEGDSVIVITVYVFYS